MIRSQVTIAIPVVNRFAYLKEAVRSALDQTYPFTEVLISQNPDGNGLNEEVRKWCEGAARENTQIRYINNKTNIEMAANWNKLAESAKGKYIIYLADDDRLLPTAVESLINLIAQTGADLAFSNHFIIDKDGERLVNMGFENTVKYKRHEIKPGLIDTPEIKAWQGSIAICTTMMKAEDVRDFRFNEDLNTPELDFDIRLCQAGRTAAFTPEYLIEYRVHGLSETSAGLKVNKLVEVLIDIPTIDMLHKYKIDCIGHLAYFAINQSILSGNTVFAKRLLSGPYYPVAKRRSLKGIVQKCFLLLPSSAATYVLKLLYKGRSLTGKWYKRLVIFRR